MVIANYYTLTKNKEEKTVYLTTEEKAKKEAEEKAKKEAKEKEKKLVEKKVKLYEDELSLIHI